MNWKRGAFRSWVVVSLAWVLITSVAGWNEYFGENEADKIVRLPDGARIAVPGDATEDEVWDMLNRGFPVVSGLSGEDRLLFKRKVADTLSRTATTPAPPAFWLFVIVSVPTLLFVIGSVVFWIAAGFKSSGLK